MNEKTFQMKMQAKQLEREARRLQKSANAERKKAKQELKRGNRAAAQLYAKNAVLYEQQANQILQNASAAHGYAADIQTAQVTAEMSKTLDQAQRGMSSAAKQINTEKLAANRTKMDGLKQNLGAAQDLLTNGEGQLDINAGAEELLQNLEAENAEDAMMQIADIPTGIPGMPAQSQQLNGQMKY